MEKIDLENMIAHRTPTDSLGLSFMADTKELNIEILARKINEIIDFINNPQPPVVG